jgi:hypothetical protein
MCGAHIVAACIAPAPELFCRSEAGLLQLRRADLVDTSTRHNYRIIVLVCGIPGCFDHRPPRRCSLLVGTRTSCWVTLDRILGRKADTGDSGHAARLPGRCHDDLDQYQARTSIAVDKEAQGAPFTTGVSNARQPPTKRFRAHSNHPQAYNPARGNSGAGIFSHTSSLSL